MKLQRKGEFLSTRVQYIPLGRIRPNPQQPRRSFDEEGLAELAALFFPAYSSLTSFP